MTTQPLAALFPQWGLKHHLQAWRIASKGKRIDTGAAFIAPDGQRFVVVKRLYTRRVGRKRADVSLQWQSECTLCGAPYQFYMPWHTSRLVRTCPAHRGKSKPQRRTPLRDAVLAELEALQLAGGSVSHESLIAACVERLPRGNGRDTRRQRIVRCLQELIDTGALPVGIAVTDESFMCN